ncbi:MAG: sigma-54-dependent Fis family transcriptional regulator [Ignavibacteriales bacterium]|nr:sigma-54-dependent Fis family transcriptional regulator [Ignavibacteriales bacterium]
MTEIKNPNKPILIVDDEVNLLHSFDLTLSDAGIDNSVLCSDSRKVEEIVHNNEFSLILLDLSMPFIRGEELLEKIAPEFPECPIIVVTGDTEIETAIKCMKLGAFDYIVKPVENTRFVTIIKNALTIRNLRDENTTLKTKLITNNLEYPEAFEEIKSISPKMKSMFHYMEAIAKTSEPILVTGETGVGKELIARALHSLSNRKGQFVTTNIAGLDDQMFSDTLFGHKRGAFTNANQDRKGQIEKASGGTIFLDEIGDLNSQSQVKLLRLLQEKEFYPLGSDNPRFTDALIILATNKNLVDMVNESTFRKDLFYRLNVHHITPIPLRERLEDLQILVEYFLEKAAKSFNKKKPTVPNELFTLLSTYNFPGNVRELKSMVYDAVSRHTSKIMSLDSFKKTISPNNLHKLETLENLTNQKVVFGETLPTLKEVQNELVQEALVRTNNNQSIAAQLLGVTRQALNRRIIQEKEHQEENKK